MTAGIDEPKPIPLDIPYTPITLDWEKIFENAPKPYCILHGFNLVQNGNKKEPLAIFYIRCNIVQEDIDVKATTENGVNVTNFMLDPESVFRPTEYYKLYYRRFEYEHFTMNPAEYPYEVLELSCSGKYVLVKGKLIV